MDINELMSKELKAVETLATLIHDTLCQCNGRCFGWENDKRGLIEYIREQRGSVYGLE